MGFKNAYPDTYALLKDYARKNRANPTMAERVLWEEIKRNRMGPRFLRQYIIGDYIVDFLCPDYGLIIEVDGAYHSEPRQEALDAMRTTWLESQGYCVIRFTNEEVLYDIETVLEEIENQLQ